MMWWILVLVEKKTCNRHLIAHREEDLWVLFVISKCCIQYGVILDRVITTRIFEFILHRGPIIRIFNFLQNT